MAVIFDCSSNLALFRKPYTTTSSVSFAFPPPTAAAGLIAAVIGLDNGSAGKGCNAAYWSELAGTRLAVSLRRPVRWFRAALNFWNVKNPQGAPHIQVKHQFVAQPQYRLYVRGGVEAALRRRLENNSFVYTPYLGVAYAIAQIDYVGSCEALPVEGEAAALDTVLPFQEGTELDLPASGRVFRELVPFKLTGERALESSVTVLYSDSGKLHLKKRGDADVTLCSARGVDECVAWFAEW